MTESVSQMIEETKKPEDNEHLSVPATQKLLGNRKNRLPQCQRNHPSGKSNRGSTQK
jgi:hypothetical protein